MKRLTVISILAVVFCLIACGTLSGYVVNGINISSSDPRLIGYADSTVVNRHMVDSLLRRIHGKYPTEKEAGDSTIDVNIPSPLGSSQTHSFYPQPGETEIIELANTFVSEGTLQIPYNFVIGPVNKIDVVKLRESFEKVPNIPAKDIIDVLNIQKKIRNLSGIVTMETNCYPSDVAYDAFEYYYDHGDNKALWDEWDDISRKYGHKIPLDTNRRIGYYVLDCPDFTLDQKIGIIENMVNRLEKARGWNDRYREVYETRIRHWHHVLDSLHSITPQD